MMNIPLKKLGLLILAGFCLIAPRLTAEVTPPTNFFNETGAILDIEDPLLDDKGPGYYQYPLDPGLPRGTYDLKRFSAYEEGNVLTFVIQMRDYIPTRSKTAKYNPEQGFVGLMTDIYIDMDRKPGSGHTKALPSRQIEFTENMGWEKMILVTPLSQYRVYDQLKDKTDDLEFQDTLNDIIIPDYVHVQRDKIIVRIKKDLLGKPSPNWGMQCFVMGFSNVVSTNQVFNKDVKAFPTKEDLGGGYDTLGDPPIMDCIVPEGDDDQYTLLRDYRSEPFAENIQKARLPFVYASKAATPTDKTKEKEASLAIKSKQDEKPVLLPPTEVAPPQPFPATAQEYNRASPQRRETVAPPVITGYDPAPGSTKINGSEDYLGMRQPPIVNQPKVTAAAQTAEKPASGFIPIKRVTASPFVPIPKKNSGFIPIKKGGPKE